MSTIDSSPSLHTHTLRPFLLTWGSLFVFGMLIIMCGISTIGCEQSRMDRTIDQSKKNNVKNLPNESPVKTPFAVDPSNPLDTDVDLEADAADPSEPRIIQWPGVVLSLDQRVIDLAAEVVYREGDWLELIATTRAGRVHEALVATEAQPSDVHAALLLLGLKNGSPLTWEQLPSGETQVNLPTGDAVSVSFIITDPITQQRIEQPTSAWVIDQTTGKTLLETNPDAYWVFAGSMFRRFEVEVDGNTEQREVYIADANGTVISLVNFGDDLLARQVTTTNQNDNAIWNASDQVPPVGTPVTVRLRPVNN